MPKVTDAHLEARRQQIIDAAGRCFTARGFHQTSMQDICRAAELSPGALYRYFDSKNALIAAVSESNMSAYLVALEDIDHDPHGRVLDRVLTIYFEALGDTRLTAIDAELNAESLRNEEIRAFLTQRLQVVRGALAQALALAQVRGEVRGDADPEALANLMVNLFWGLKQLGALTMSPQLQIQKSLLVTLMQASPSGHGATGSNT